MNPAAGVAAFLEPRHVALAEALRGTASRRFGALPACESDEEARRAAPAIVRALGEEGLLRHAVPDGGSESRAVDHRALCLVREALGATSPLADALFALQALGSTPIALAGSEALRARWLPAVADGTAIAGFAMTEREAGSDVGAIATTARRDGGDWILDGEKRFISNAGLADFYTVFASTDRALGVKGLSCFVVPADARGFRFVRPLVLSEPHPLGEIAFDGCRIPADHLLGEAGRGFQLGMRTLDRLRPTVAAAACGMAGRALAEALGHARSRRQFGSPLADRQLVQAMLATMATELDAARLLVFRAAWELDRAPEGGRATKEAAMAKWFATEAAQRIVDQAVQIHGGSGVLADAVVDRLYRSVRTLRIYEGTSEIQQIVIARELLKG
ncbi:MAG: acyl-CoA dehydrogenase family protein [Thermoanaerobaculia bacterium]